jgi:hypothetical protein
MPTPDEPFSTAKSQLGLAIYTTTHTHTHTQSEGCKGGGEMGVWGSVCQWLAGHICVEIHCVVTETIANGGGDLRLLHMVATAQQALLLSALQTVEHSSVYTQTSQQRRTREKWWW